MTIFKKQTFFSNLKKKLSFGVSFFTKKKKVEDKILMENIN